MRSRRAAFGATTVALALAATGSSLAAVRAARYDGGVAASGIALRAPAVTRSGAQPTVPPSADDLVVPEVPVSPGIGPAGPAPGAGGEPTTAPGGQPSPAGTSSAGSARSAPSQGAGVASAARPAATATAARPVTPSTLPPASGPTPTTSPVTPATVSCPSNAGKGALPVRGGPLQAVDFALRWPMIGPVVLVPQASASRPAEVAVTIAHTSAPQMAADGTSLTLLAPVGISYTLQAGSESARGTIRFTGAAGPDVSVGLVACRNASFALYDVNKAVLGGSPLRIVGMVAPQGTVTISSDGGVAFFRSATPGAHKVIVLTANDAGVAGKVIAVTVTVA